MSTITPAPSLLSRTFARGLLKIAAAAGCIAAAAMGGCGSTAMPTRISQDTEVLGQIQASPNAVPSEEIQKCAGVAIIKYTAAKRVIHRWRIAGRGPENFRPRLAEHALFVGILPLHQLADDVEQPLALRLDEDVFHLRLQARRRVAGHRHS